MNIKKRNKEIILLLAIGLSGPLIGEMHNIGRTQVHNIKMQYLLEYQQLVRKSKHFLMAEYIDLIKS